MIHAAKHRQYASKLYCGQCGVGPWRKLNLNIALTVSCRVPGTTNNNVSIQAEANPAINAHVSEGKMLIERRASFSASCCNELER